jgi:hypothetical protein
MTQNVFDLLDRKIGRLKDEHVGSLLSIQNEALTLFDVSRRATARDSLDYFARATIEALWQYAADARKEVLTFTEQTQIVLDEDGKASVLGIVSKHFDVDLYLHRFRIYEEALARHMSRFGLSIDLTAFRSDLVKASHHAGTTNFIRSFLASLADDLEVLVLRAAQSAAINNSQAEPPLEMNRLLKLEPNIFGFGFNLNYVIDKLFRKKR